MKIKERWLEHYKYILSLIVIVAVPKLIIALISDPMQVTDEFGTLAAPAYLAGLDWSYMSGVVSYYGTGYHILFTPLFCITDNPFIIYKTILSSYVLLETVVAIIIYYLCNRYLIKEDKLFACLAAIAVVYLRATKVTSVSNEFAIFFIVWIVVLLLFELYNGINNKKRKCLLTFFLIGVLAYSLTIHTRNIAILALAVMVVFYVAFCQKKCIVSLPICGVMGVILFGVVQLYNTYIKEIVWMQNRKEEGLANSSAVNEIAKLDRILKLTDKDHMYAFLNTIVGQIDTVNIMTAGFFVFALILCIYVIFITVIKKKTKDWYIICGILAVFGLLGCLGILGMQAVTWLNVTKDAMDIGYGSNAAFFKSFTYVRYFEPFIGPAILMAIVYMHKKRVELVYIVSAIITVLGQIYWYRWIMPFIYNNITSARFYIPFTFGTYEQECTWLTYIPATCIMIVMVIFIGFLLKKRLISIIVFVLCGLMIYQYMYWGFSHENEWTVRGDAGYQLVSELEEVVELDTALIVPYKAMAYTYQFMLNRYHITMDMPAASDSALIFTNRMADVKYDEYIIEHGYTAYVLDDNEFFYVKEPEIIEIMDEWGYERLSL